MKGLFLVGRVVLGGFFLYNGIKHFKNRKSLAQYADAKKVPLPDAAIIVSGALLTMGGASLILGLKPKAGAAAIVSFLVTISPIMHDFWHSQDPNQRMNEMVNFSKNLALLGAVLALAGVEEPWAAAVSQEAPRVATRVLKSAMSLVA